MMTFGKLLKAARNRKGLTQVWVAQQLGDQTNSNYNQTEKGKRGLPEDKIKTIATVYGLDAKHLKSIEEVWDIPEAANALIKEYFPEYCETPYEKPDLYSERADGQGVLPVADGLASLYSDKPDMFSVTLQDGTLATLVPAPQSQLRTTHVMGRVAAGLFNPAEQQEDLGTVTFTHKGRLHPATFALEVQGHSMSPAVHDGGHVIVAPADRIKDGLWYVVVDKDYNATLKEVRTLGGGLLRLKPVNNDYNAQEIHQDDLDSLYEVIKIVTDPPRKAC